MSSYRAELSNRKRQKGESLRALSADIARLSALAYQGPRDPRCDELTTEHFIRSLDDPDLEMRVRECMRGEPADLDTAFIHAQRLESYHTNRERDSGDHQVRGRIRDNYQARAVNNRSGNSSGANNRSNQPESTDAGQIKIQNLEKENEEIKREMQFLRDSVQNMQVRAVGPSPQVVPQTVPMTSNRS